MTTQCKYSPFLFRKNLLSTALVFLSYSTLSTVEAEAAVFTQAVVYNGLHQPASTDARGVLNMSRDGRYILTSPTPFETSGGTYGIVDVKKQSVIALPPRERYGLFAISPNGRYVSHAGATFNGLPSIQVADRLQQTVHPTNTHDEHLALSDNGYVASGNQDYPSEGEGGALHRLSDQDRTPLPGIWSGISSSMYRTDWFSADGKVVLYEATISADSGEAHFLIHNVATQTTIDFNPLRSDGSSIFGNINTQPEGATNIALSSNGKYVAFTAPSGPIEHYIWRATLTGASYTLERFNLGALKVKVVDGIAVSSNGRFVSFNGELLSNHPEYVAGLSPRRVFRYDAVLNKVITISVAKDGSPLRNRSSSPAEQIEFYPATNISDDGSIVQYATNADNVLAPATTNGLTVRKYYAIVDTDMPTRNYQFIHLQNSDTGAFAPMTLTSNNVWEGKLTFDGIGTETFKFDAGGRVVNGQFTLNANLIGAGSSASQAAIGGANITVTGGAGTYNVVFNDQTLTYSVTKDNATSDWKRTVVMMYGQTQTGQDMFIRGGLDHQKALANLGRNCDANNSLCSMPIRHINKLNPTTAPWKQGDTKLDWQGIEVGQGSGAQGTPLDWTTDFWPTSWGAKKTVAVNGFGETPLNIWGQHYWLLDVEMDCSRTVNGWFELKSFISNGPGWENNIVQPGTLPWSSNNHFAQCGKLNVFKRNQNAPVTIGNL